MRCLDRGEGRCSVLVAHRCATRAARLRADSASALAAAAIVATLGLLIGRAM